MRRLMIVLVAALAVVDVALAKLSYPIVDTDQTKFYNNMESIARPGEGDAFYGQDAHHAGNKPSYTNNGDGTISDNVTGLMWQQEFEVMSYDDAVAQASHSTFAGYNDWRVPTIKEAYSLIVFSGTDASTSNMEQTPQGAIPFIDTKFFAFKYGANGSRPIDSQMLSTNKYVGSTQQQLVFGVNLADGRIKGYPIANRGETKKYMVRFVRGEAYGENKLEDNNDGTISDTATALMWQKSDSGKGLDWQEALEYAQKMNKQRYAGYDDWRLPNAKELQSIVDYSRSPESTSSAAIAPIFNITQIKNEGGERDYPFFWSSTTHVSASARRSGSSAVYVSFGRALGNMPQVRRQASSSAVNWINIHGAGAQRSDPKSGDPSRFEGGRGPQGDAIRIDNYVRLVRDL